MSRKFLRSVARIWVAVLLSVPVLCLVVCLWILPEIREPFAWAFGTLFLLVSFFVALIHG